MPKPYRVAHHRVVGRAEALVIAVRCFMEKQNCEATITPGGVSVEVGLFQNFVG